METYQELTELAYKQLYQEGAFLITGKEEKNPTTIGWCQFGRLWNAPILTIFVRPTRYAHDLIEKDGLFTVAFPKDSSMRQALHFCGTRSGRDINKREQLKMETIPNKRGGIDGLLGNFVHFECKVTGRAELKSGLTFLEQQIKKSFYNPQKEEGEEGNLHTVYYGEILAAYKTE